MGPYFHAHSYDYGNDTPLRYDDPLEEPKMYDIVSFTKYAGMLVEKEILTTVSDWQTADRIMRTCNQVAPAHIVVLIRERNDGEEAAP